MTVERTQRSWKSVTDFPRPRQGTREYSCYTRWEHRNTEKLKKCLQPQYIHHYLQKIKEEPSWQLLTRQQVKGKGGAGIPLSLYHKQWNVKCERRIKNLQTEDHHCATEVSRLLWKFRKEQHKLVNFAIGHKLLPFIPSVQLGERQYYTNYETYC